jgi:hypothetical protein
VYAKSSANEPESNHHRPLSSTNHWPTGIETVETGTAPTYPLGRARPVAVR